MLGTNAEVHLIRTHGLVWGNPPNHGWCIDRNDPMATEYPGRSPLPRNDRRRAEVGLAITHSAYGSMSSVIFDLQELIRATLCWDAVYGTAKFHATGLQSWSKVYSARFNDT
jgi:hypothetical protein